MVNAPHGAGLKDKESNFTAQLKMTLLPRRALNTAWFYNSINSSDTFNGSH